MGDTTQPTTRPVLVLGSGTRALLATVRSLGRHNIPVHVQADLKDAIARRSKYIVATHELPDLVTDTDRWVESLVRLVEREGFSAIMPCDDAFTSVLVRNRRDLEAHTTLAVPNDEAVSIASDKIASWELATRLEIATPDSVVVSDIESHIEEVTALGWPVVVKPRSSFPEWSLGKKQQVAMAHSEDELRRVLRSFEGQLPVLCQRFVTGAAIGFEWLADRGDVLCAHQAELDHLDSGGMSNLRRSVPASPDLLSDVERLLKELNYTGVGMIDAIRDPDDGRCIFLEINSRLWGALPLSVAAGADFPYFYYRLLLEEERAFTPHYRQGLSCRNLAGDLARARSRHPDNPISAVLDAAGQLARFLARAALRKETADTWARDDLSPALAEARHVIKLAR